MILMRYPGAGTISATPLRAAVGIGDLDLDSRIHRVGQIRGAEEDPAIGLRRDLEFQVQYEVTVLVPRPQVVRVVRPPVEIALQVNLAVDHLPGPVGSHLPSVQAAPIEQADESCGIVSRVLGRRQRP